jgi:two-component system sensor histidine kinase VicK
MLTVELPNEVEAAFAYDVRTPLTSIRSFVATLLQAGEESFDWETRAEFLKIVGSEAERLRRMIDDFLIAVRLQNGLGLEFRFTAVDLDLLIPRVVRLQSKRCDAWDQDKLVTTRIELEPLGVAVVDKGKIEQVLDNLLSDAFIRSPQGSTITVAGGVEGNGVRISIHDLRKSLSGGRPPRPLQRIFRSRRRNERGDNITSLDRFVVERLIEGHAGRIWAESEFSRGSTVHVWLPKDGPPEEPAPAESAQTSPYGGNRR